MKFGLRELLFFGLLAAIPVGSYFWIFKPANENWIRHRQQYNDQAEKLKELTVALGKIDDLSQEIENLAKAVEFFESKLPARHEIHKVLEDITRISEKQQLETRIFKTGKPKPFSLYNEQPIEMELYGSFESFYQFLLDIEQMPRITRISNMEIEKDNTVPGAMTVKFLLSVYYDNKQS